ncbi:MAG: SpoIIE family protein phosphatase [Flavobacteriales bacterium]|nr:SpoIIE family protein phosphatase [Flavobacteriales bacterium]
MRLLLVLVCAFFSTGIIAQKTPFIAYGEEDLNAKFIYDIAQLSNNDLLVACEKGLFTYDGYQFVERELYLAKERTIINKVFVASNNIVWIGNSSGQIWSVDTIIRSSVLHDTGFDSEISSIAEDLSGAVWVASKTSGIIKFGNSNDGVFEHFKMAESTLVHSFMPLKDGHLLLGTDQGLLLGKASNGAISLIDKVVSIPPSKITFLNRYEQKVYVGTSDEGLFILNFNDHLDLQLVKKLPQLSSSNLLDLELCNNDILWAATASNGLIELQGDNSTFFGPEDGIDTESVNCLFKDAEQNLWIGTFGKGLFRKYNSAFKPVWRTTEGDTEVKDVEFLNGKVYVATSNGIDVLVSSGIEFESTTTLSIADPVSLAVFQKYLFVATVRSGILCFEGIKQIDKFKEIQTVENVNHILTHESKLYISTSTGGLIIYDLIKNTSKQFNTQNGLTHNEVNSCFVDSKGKIWLAMSGTVLNAIEDNEIVLYGKEEGILQYDLSSVTEDSSGQIWISSEGGGLYAFKQGDLKHFHKDNGLSSNYITSVLAHDTGAIWASSTYSISRLDLKSGNIKKYNTKENIFNFSISKDGLNDNNDSLFLCTNKGLFLYDKSNDIDISIQPYLRFTKIQINDSLYSVNEAIKLPYGKYSLRAQFKTKYLAEQQKIKYRYYLNGQEEDYGPGFAEPNCYYPGLLKGDQELRVQSTDLNGNWVNEPLVRSISIDIPFYQKPLFVGFTSLGVLLFMTGFVFYREKMNKKIQTYLNTELDLRTLEVRRQKDELAEKNQEIQDSIIYAERIQRSMLSSRKIVEKNTKDNFIFYKPRDIVSGDFYWFSEVNDHFIFAGADCTGHGVPGSMMSMICISELDKAVKIDRLTDPNAILEKVDLGLREALHQNEENTANDGMDIGLCVLNKKEDSLKFSGAGRPCYVIRNGVLEEIKGSRHHIGGAENDQKTFEVHDIDLKDGIRIYLSSDGYVDQFGGEKGKKYLRKRFRELLLRLAKKPLKDQLEVFKKELEEWQGDHEQVDDVLVLAVDL